MSLMSVAAGPKSASACRSDISASTARITSSPPSTSRAGYCSYGRWRRQPGRGSTGRRSTSILNGKAQPVSPGGDFVARNAPPKRPPRTRWRLVIPTPTTICSVTPLRCGSNQATGARKLVMRLSTPIATNRPRNLLAAVTTKEANKNCRGQRRGVYTLTDIGMRMSRSSHSRSPPCINIR